LVFAVVCLGNYVWPPTYESSARLRLTRGREVYQTDASVTKSMEGVAMVQMSAQDVNSEIDLIASKDVLEFGGEGNGPGQDFPVSRAYCARSIARRRNRPTRPCTVSN